jgi:mannan endo-1,4-beta-mannosidase
MKTKKIFFIKIVFTIYIIFNINLISSQTSKTSLYWDAATEHLFKSLRAIGNSDFFMFGVPNALTISYLGGPMHCFNDSSDCKSITGSHPAFIESDFLWYDNPNFKKCDIEAMKEAYKKGAVLGYCYHLRGLKSNEFYTYSKNKVFTSDSTLVKDILANPDRNTNQSLNWYLTRLDTLVIPVFKELSFPLIYRPFHEMTGGWFWWGTSTCTPDELVKLYRLTVDYLRANGIRNVLYAWAPDKSTDLRFYPGDDYIDIVGYDGYDIGIADYHSVDFFINNIKFLSDFADKHQKIFAITETGTGKLTKYPQFWTKHVFYPLFQNNLHKKIAWIMTWYSADWKHDYSGVSFIPYIGINNKEGGKEAIDDFIQFYNLPHTLFLNDLPPMYLNSNSKSFILPHELEIKTGNSFNLLGGSTVNWFNEINSWKSENTDIVEVDLKGKVYAKKSGITFIKMTTKSGDTKNIKITVTD